MLAGNRSELGLGEVVRLVEIWFSGEWGRTDELRVRRAENHRHIDSRRIAKIQAGLQEVERDGHRGEP